MKQVSALERKEKDHAKEIKKLSAVEKEHGEINDKSNNKCKT